MFDRRLFVVDEKPRSTVSDDVRSLPNVCGADRPVMTTEEPNVPSATRQLGGRHGECSGIPVPDAPTPP